MRPALPLAALLLVTGCAAGKPPAGPAPAAETPDTGGDRTVEYHALLSRLRAADTTVDFTRLRLAYAGSREYSPYATEGPRLQDSAAAALERGDLPRARLAADSALALDYLDPDGQVLLAYILAQSGDTVRADWHRMLAWHLLDSVMRSGNGRTADSAWVVISVREEYSVLRALGFKPGSQRVDQCGPHACDVLSGVHYDTGEEGTFYFDISLPMSHLQNIYERK